MIVVELSMKHSGVHPKGTLLLSDIIESIKRRRDFRMVGALAFFTGVVRGETKQGENVKRLQLDAYEEKADEVLEKISKDLMSSSGIVDVQIHHFTGEFELGEDIVYVVVAGNHREDVFPVLEKAVERYKREAPIFKKEYVKDKRGRAKSYWVSESGERR